MHSGENKSKKISLTSQRWRLRWPQPFTVLAVFLVVVFLTGGSSRADISSLMILRPVAVIVLAIGLATLSREHIWRNRWLFILASAVVILVIAHLVSLPPALWQALPGRELVVAIDRLAGLEGIWRPLSLDPRGTWNAFWALTVPLAALVLAAQLDGRNQYRLLALLIALGLLSALIALLQILGSSNGPLYFYRITNFGQAVGLFANRNHQAVMLATLLPLIAAALTHKRSAASGFLTSGKARLAAFILAALFLVPLILIAGSRAGLLALLLAIFLSAWVVSQNGIYAFIGERGRKIGRKPSWAGMKWIPWALLAGFLALIALTYYADRSIAIERFLERDAADDMRIKIVPLLVDLARLYSPLGSGIGSFESVFMVHEPDTLLAPQYVNHAHNEFLEIAITAGIPGIVLIVFAGVLVLAGMRRIALSDGGQSAVGLGRAGFAVLFLFAIASAVDYPVRVPSIQVWVTLAGVWLARGWTLVR